MLVLMNHGRIWKRSGTTLLQWTPSYSWRGCRCHNHWASAFTKLKSWEDGLVDVWDFPSQEIESCPLGLHVPLRERKVHWPRLRCWWKRLVLYPRLQWFILWRYHRLNGDRWTCSNWMDAKAFSMVIQLFRIQNRSRYQRVEMFCSDGLWRLIKLVRIQLRIW